MRIAIVGLGSIAQRAYLPTLRRLSDVELILCRRDRARLVSLRRTLCGPLLRGSDEGSWAVPAPPVRVRVRLIRDVRIGFRS